MGLDFCGFFFPPTYMGYLTSNNIFQQRKKESMKANAYFFMSITHSIAFLVSVFQKLWLNMTSYLFLDWLFCMEYCWLRINTLSNTKQHRLIYSAVQGLFLVYEELKSYKLIH